MCSLFGLIDFKECLSTHTKNKILNTLAREVSGARHGRDRHRLLPSTTACEFISVLFLLGK